MYPSFKPTWGIKALSSPFGNYFLATFSLPNFMRIKALGEGAKFAPSPDLTFHS
jgi:hypothetical protein